MTAIQINPTAARTKLRRLSVAADSQNDQVRALSRRYADLIATRVELERTALPPPPATSGDQPARRRSRVASDYAANELTRVLSLTEWHARFSAEQARLAELDDEIAEVLAQRDALSARWAAGARVVERARVELARLTGARVEAF